MKQKEIYNGLTTRRFEVESSPIMAESEAKLKVKTYDVSSTTTEWNEETPTDALPTTITSTINF